MDWGTRRTRIRGIGSVWTQVMAESLNGYRNGAGDFNGQNYETGALDGLYGPEGLDGHRHGAVV